MPRIDRDRIIAAARTILDRRRWCVLETCLDIPAQEWVAELLMFELTPSAIADVVAEEIARDPSRDVRLTACDRWTLAPDPGAGAYVCHLADVPV